MELGEGWGAGVARCVCAEVLHSGEVRPGRGLLYLRTFVRARLALLVPLPFSYSGSSVSSAGIADAATRVLPAFSSGQLRESAAFVAAG